MPSIDRPLSGPASPRTPIRRKPLPPGASPLPLTSSAPSSSSSSSSSSSEANSKTTSSSSSPPSPVSSASSLELFPRPPTRAEWIESPLPTPPFHPDDDDRDRDRYKYTDPNCHPRVRVPDCDTLTPGPPLPGPGHAPARNVNDVPKAGGKPSSSSGHSNMAANPSINVSEDQAQALRNNSIASSSERTNSQRFTSFFRWGSQSAGSETEASPAISPKSQSPPPANFDTANMNGSYTKSAPPPAIDIPLANGVHDNEDSAMYLGSSSEFEMIEDEVRQVSADLAASIRREMDLEDLIDRLQAEAAAAGHGEKDRRTSDYFSDAGTPARIIDPETNMEMDVGKIMRKGDQERASLRLELLGKVQEERDRRRVVENQVKELRQQLSKGGSAASPSTDSGSVKAMETALDDAKRRLAEERTTKENFEDLLTALREELEANRNERDNLRDEVVPSLRLQVEGLEAEASELKLLTYEHTRMQQELAELKHENSSLAMSLKNQRRQSTASGYSSPIERSNSHSLMNGRDRENLTEKLKEVEAQRDALHKALKSLRDRQQYESKKSLQRIRTLEAEKAKELTGTRRQGRDREVTSLRKEVERLRRRADEALEQKFVCERNLGTLKMDLEKAEQETATLRALLEEHDTLIAQHSELQDSHHRLSQEVTELKAGLGLSSSASLQQAYSDLQDVHTRSLARLSELENRDDDNDTENAELSRATAEGADTIASLRRSLSQSEAARTSAEVDAEAYRKRSESLQKSEKMHLAEERALSTQLRISSERVEELAAQVTAQLASNNALRTRLADAIERGEASSRENAKRINDLQGRLKRMEDKVSDAQTSADEAVAQYEDEIRKIRETHTSQLRRLKTSTGAVGGALKSPALLKSPKLEWTKRISVDGNRTEMLERRVEELERALREADEEMAEVVGRMSLAQIEVLELQSERDEAMRTTRKLQTEVALERAKYKGIEV